MEYIMANVIDVNFWTLLRGLNSALEERNVEQCLGLLQMMTCVDDAELLDSMAIIEHFQIVLVIKKAGEIGFGIWKQVVSESCWKRQYDNFLQEEIKNNLTESILVSDNSIKIANRKWIGWKPSYKVQQDLIRIQLMCDIHCNSEWRLRMRFVEELLEEISLDAEGGARIVKVAIKNESNRILTI